MSASAPAPAATDALLAAVADAVAHSNRAARHRVTIPNATVDLSAPSAAAAASTAASPAPSAALPASSRPSSSSSAAHGPVNGMSWKEYSDRSLAREQKYGQLFDVQSMLTEAEFLASKYATLGSVSTPSTNSSGSKQGSTSSNSSVSGHTVASDSCEAGFLFPEPPHPCPRATPQCLAALRIMNELIRNVRLDDGTAPEWTGDESGRAKSDRLPEATAVVSAATARVLKDAVDYFRASPSSTPSSTQGLLQHVENIAWMASALPLFLPQCLADIALAAEPSARDADPARLKIDVKVARQAVRALGTFLHNCELVKCFPQPRAEAWIRARRHEAEAAAAAAQMHEEHKAGDVGDSDMHDASSLTASTSSASSAQESYFAAHDGFDRLLSVAVSTTDRTLATWLCWLLAEQALSARAMAAYVSPLLDSFDRMMTQFIAREKVQQSQYAASAAASPTKVAKASGSNGTAAPSAAILAVKSLQSLNSLHSEALRAIEKFAKNCKLTMRAHSLRPAREPDDRPMHWLQLLVIEPFLSPSEYFACCAFLPAPAKGSTPAHPTHAASLKQRVNSRKAALDLTRWMLADDVLARHIVFDKFSPSNSLPLIAPGCTQFALSMHRCIVGQEWVKAVAAELASRVAQLESVRLDKRRTEIADARDKQVKIEGQAKAASSSAPISSRQASYALSDPDCESRKAYEMGLLMLHSEAFQLLEVYLATMGPLCSFSMPAPAAPAAPAVSAPGATAVTPAAGSSSAGTSSPSAASGGGVAINEFFTLATHLFRVDSTPCAPLRALAFEALWLPICRQLNVGFKMSQVDATAAFLAALASGSRIEEPRFPASLHKLQAKPLPVTLKPFLHHLPKEPNAGAAAVIMRTALVILGEHFLSLAPMPSNNSGEDMAPSSTPASSAQGTGAAASAAHQSAVFVLPNLHPCAPHRIWDPLIYSACLAPLLALLCPFPAGAPLAPASAASSASSSSSSSAAVSLPLLKFESSEKWDSHARARLIDRIIELFKQADAAAKAAAFAEGAHHGHQPSTGASSSLSYVSLSSNSSALAQAAPADPLSFLPALVNVLLSAPASNLPRASFLSWIASAVNHRMLAKIAGNTERKAAITEGFAYLLEKAVCLSLSAARSKLSSSSSKASVAAVSPIANAPPSLLHALFQSWSGFALSLASRAVLVRPAAASTPAAAASPAAAAALALSVERHANRVLFMAQMQTEILNLWMSHRSRLEMLPNLVLEGEQQALAAATTVTSPRSLSDAGYNATPTPLSAPVGGSSASQSPPGFSAPLASFFSLWCTTFSPLLSDRLQGDLSPVIDRLKDVFLEGVLSMVEAHLHRMARLAETQRAHPASFHRAAGGNGTGGAAGKFNSLQCLSSVLESLVRSQILPDGSRAHLVTLLYTLHLKTHAVLLREQLPALSGEGGRPMRGGSEGTLGSVSPSMAAGASLESMGGGGGGGGAGAGTAAAGGTLGSEAPSVSTKSVSSRESLSRVARSLANAVSQHLSEEADSVQQLWMHDPSAARAAQDASESSRAEQAVEALIAAVLLPTRLPALMPAQECAVILPAFSSATSQLVRLALSTSDFESPVAATMPDVLSSLTSALLDVLRECSLTTSSQGYGNLLRIGQTLMAALHPASPSAPHKSSSSEAAAAATTGGGGASNLVSWKQWKSHADASVQKVINALMEEAVRRGLDQQQNQRPQSQAQQQSQRSKTDGDAMEDVPSSTPVAASTVVASQLDFATFLPFVQSLTQLLARLPPTGSTNLDAIAWVLRLMPAFHSMLRALHGSVDPSFSLTSAPMTPMDSILIAVGQLWTTALQAFRSNWGARTYDFNLLQAVVSKTNAAASAVPSSQQHASTPRPSPPPPAAAASSSSAAAKDVLFIDMLTLSLLHSLASVRAAAVSFWTHTYAAGTPPTSARKGSAAHASSTSLARLHFHAHPEFVAACRARCDAGELKEWQVPLTPAQQAEANAAAAAAAQAALVGSLVAPSSLQMGSQQQQLASPNAASRSTPAVAPPSAASAARSETAPPAAGTAALQSSPSWIPVSQSPTLLHFKQNDKRTVVGGGRDADAAVSSSEATGGDGEEDVVDLTKDAGAAAAAAAPKTDGATSSHSSDDMNLTGMMNDAAVVSSGSNVPPALALLQPPANSPPLPAAVPLPPVAPQSAEKASLLNSPFPPSTPLPASSAGPSPSSTAATSSGASHVSAAIGVSSTSHSFLPSNAFSKRRKNLLDRMIAVTPRIPSDLVAAPPVAAAAQQPNHEMVRTASDVLAIAQAQAVKLKEAEAAAAGMSPEASAAARNTLSPFPATPKAPAAAVTPDSVVSSAAAAKPSTEADAVAPVRLLSEFERASQAALAAVSSTSAPAAPTAAAGSPPIPAASQPKSSQSAAAPVRVAPASKASQAAASSGHLDDIAQSLSLSMGSSISQPQLPVEDESEEQAEGAEAAVPLAPAQPGASTQAAAAPSAHAPDADGDAQMGDAETAAVPAAVPTAPAVASPPKTGRTPSWLQRARINLQMQSQPVVGATKDIPLPILSAPAHISVPTASQTSVPAALPSASQAARAAVLEASTQSFAGPDAALVAASEPAALASQDAATAAAPVSAASASSQAGSESAVAGAIDASPAAPIFPSAADVIATLKPAASSAAASQPSPFAPAAAASAIPQAPPADAAAAVAEPAAVSPPKKKRERDSPTHSPSSSTRDADTRESAVRARRRSPSPSGAASSARRVMFSEAANVAISPSPLFSTLSPSVHASLGHGSRDEEHEGADDAAAGDQKQADEEEESPAEKTLRLSLTPLSHSQSDAPPKKDHGPVLSRAERIALRASQMASHAEKKAALKALANPAGAAATQQAAGGGPIPILKRTPTPAHPAAAATEAASSSAAASAAAASSAADADSSSLHPSLSSSLSPVSHLVSCFPSSALGRLLVSFEGSFFSHVMHWVTIGDVAATSIGRVRAAVESKGAEWSTPIVNAITVAAAKKGATSQDAASASSPVDRIVQLIRSALATYEEKQSASHRKRKTPAAETETNDALVAVLPEEPKQDEPQQPANTVAALAAPAPATMTDDAPAAAAAANDAADSSSSSAFKKARITPAGGSDPAAAVATPMQIAHQDRTLFLSAPALGASVAGGNEVAPSHAMPATAFVSMPAPAALVRQLSASRAASVSQSQQLSCNSQRANSSSSPCMPFVAPEFTFRASAPTPVTINPASVPAAAAAAANATEVPKPAAPIKPVASPALPLPSPPAHRQSTSDTPPSAAVAVISSSPAAAFAAPTMHAPAPVAPTTLLRPQPLPASADSLPQLESTAASAFVPPALSIRPAPAVAATASSAAAPDVMADDADEADAVGGVGSLVDLAGSGSEDQDSGPMGAQMDRLRFHMRSSMAMLFAPTHTPTNAATAAAQLPPINAPPPAFGQLISPPAAAPGAAASAFPPAVVPVGSNVVADLSLSQLREIHSYAQSMVLAVQQQLRRRERSEMAAAAQSSRRDSIGGGATTPNRNQRRADSAAGNSPKR